MRETFSTADLCDAFAHRCVTCETQFTHYGGRRVFSGRIRTVECREDNALVRHLLSAPSTGEVLVVDGGGSLRAALLGDQLATLGLNNGWSGVVIHGAVRDIAMLAQLDFGVKALGSNPRRSAKLGTGVIDASVKFGGVTFTPGHWLYSDPDGLLLAPEAIH
jgi:regulator of ribonuclease activity A